MAPDIQFLIPEQIDYYIFFPSRQTIVEYTTMTIHFYERILIYQEKKALFFII